MEIDDRLAVQEAKRNIYAGFGFLVLAGLLIASNLTLKNPGFDPLGPAFMPRFALAVVGVSAVILLGQGLLALRKLAIRTGGAAARAAPLSLVRPVGAIVLLAAYIELLVLQVSSFEVITPFYLFASGALLGPRTPRALIALAILAVGASLVVGYVFKTLLYVNLP